MHARMVMEGHGLVGLQEEDPHTEVRTFVHLHAGSRGVLHIGMIVPPFCSERLVYIQVLRCNRIHLRYHMTYIGKAGVCERSIISMGLVN